MVGPDRQLTVHTDNAGVAVVAGEIDLRTAARFEQTIRSMVDAGGRVVLDLADLTFCDSTGVAIFVRLHQRAHAAGGELVLRAPPARFVHVLAITGVDQLLNLQP